MDFKIIGIMACDPRGVIGNQGKIPWKIEAEIQHFLQTVKGGILVMGRRTYDSLPLSLKLRHQCIVFSRKNWKNMKNNNNIVAGHVAFIPSVEEFKKLNLENKIFMIGGAEIAHLFLKENMISEFILSIMNTEYEGNVKLDLSLFKNWTKLKIISQKYFKVYQLISPQTQPQYLN